MKSRKRIKVTRKGQGIGKSISLVVQTMATRMAMAIITQILKELRSKITLMLRDWGNSFKITFNKIMQSTSCSLLNLHKKKIGKIYSIIH